MSIVQVVGLVFCLGVLLDNGLIVSSDAPNAGSGRWGQLTGGRRGKGERGHRHGGGKGHDHGGEYNHGGGGYGGEGGYGGGGYGGGGYGGGGYGGGGYGGEGYGGGRGPGHDGGYDNGGDYDNGGINNDVGEWDNRQIDRGDYDRQEGGGQIIQIDVHDRGGQNTQVDQNPPVQQGTTIVDDFIFAITEDQEIYANPYGSGSKVSRHPNMTAMNLGKSRLYGTAAHREYFGYRTVIQSEYLDPGKAVEFTFPDLYFVTYLEVKNWFKTRGFFWVARSPLNGPDTYPILASRAQTYNLDVRQAVITRKMANNEIKLSKPADLLQNIDSIFYPNNFHYSWRSYINKMSKSEHQVAIRDLVENELIPISSKINTLRRDIRSSDFSRRYMEFVSTLSNLENRCIFDVKDDVDNQDNFEAVSLYTRIVNLKLAIHVWGTSYAKQVRIDSNDVQRLNTNTRDLVQNAPQHIRRVADERMDNVYRTCEPHNMYGDHMYMRTHMSVNALNYVHYWNEITDGDYIEHDVTSFSSYHGRPTLDIYKQAYVSFGSAPFTPETIRVRNGRGRRARLTNIELYTCDSNPEPILCVGSLTFENNIVYNLGENIMHLTKSSRSLNLNNVRIRKLEVGGSDRIEHIRFHLSDNREVHFGFKNSQPSATFEMENHHIASIHFSSVGRNNGEIANIAVSYGLDTLDDVSKRLRQRGRNRN